MKKIVRYVDQLTNRIIPDGPAHDQSRARHQVSVPYSGAATALPSPSLASSFPSHPGSPTDSRSKRSLISHARRWITNRRRCLVDMLPDDALLVIFDFYVPQYDLLNVKAWPTLVHVCRRWRGLVFASPRRFNLRLHCSSRTPARDTLDVWPALPLMISCYNRPKKGVDNIIAALKRSNCIYEIALRHWDISSSDLEIVLAAMQTPFPELECLELKYESVRVQPNSFLGGSVPSLRSLWLDGIPFPGLPKLLLSATHLTNLRLYHIPHSGYFSPEAMVTAISTLTNLKFLDLGFQSPLSRPDPASRRLPPPLRFALPVLTQFLFKGVTEYLDDVVAHIDAPQLHFLSITFFNQILFDTPQLIQLISRTPTLNPFERALVSFDDGASTVRLSSNTYYESCSLQVKILCEELDWQVSSVEQVFTSCLPPLSTLKELYILAESRWLPYWQDNIESMLWLELLHPFTGVKDLFLSDEFGLRIVSALQELVGSRTTEVLPALQNLFLEELELLGLGIGGFIATRQGAGHPVEAFYWDRRLYKRDDTRYRGPVRLFPQQRTASSLIITNMVSRGRRLINALHL